MMSSHLTKVSWVHVSENDTVGRHSWLTDVQQETGRRNAVRGKPGREAYKVMQNMLYFDFFIVFRLQLPICTERYWECQCSALRHSCNSCLIQQVLKSLYRLVKMYMSALVSDRQIGSRREKRQCLLVINNASLSILSVPLLILICCLVARQLTLCF